MSTSNFPIASTPYYLAFAAGGRPNACYSPPSPSPVPTPASPLELPTLSPAVLSPPTSPSPPFAHPHEVPSLKVAPLPSKDFSPSTSDSLDSLYKKEVEDSLPSLPAASFPPAAASFPSHHTRGGYGQDAWFVESVPGSSLQSFGVADGVGGWRSQGVDSGIISRAVMDKCMEQVRVCRETMSPSAGARSASTSAALSFPPPPSSLASPPPTLPFSLPSHILAKAYASVKEEKVVTAGSTTACVLTVTPYRCLPRHSPTLVPPSFDDKGGSGGEHRDPRSPPPSPRDFEQRHQLSLDDEKEGHADSRPTSAAVPIPQPPTFVDSDSDSDVDASFTSHLSPSASTLSTASTDSSAGPSPSLTYKTASAFWNAVGQVMAPSSTSTSGVPSPSLPASPMTSPPPSRPPSPSSPPLFLSCASLGDSGFLLLRHHRVIHRSDIQRVGRIVKQLAIIPPHLSGPLHRYCNDAPTDAALSSHRVEEGDVIIVGSDGLLDNLCSSWGPGLGAAAGGFFVPWGRFLLGGGAGGEDEGDKEVLEKQNRKVEALVKECWIDWEAREMEGGGEGGVRGGGGKESFVRLLCDRLVSEASEFMTTVEGKPDDLTVLVLQVGKIK